MKKQPLIQCEYNDLIRTDFNVSLYMQNSFGESFRLKKKRNSVIIDNLQKDIKQNLRLVTNLCAKPKQYRKSVSPGVSSIDNNVLRIPVALSLIDGFTEDSRKTPLKNELLRSIQTPVWERSIKSHKKKKKFVSPTDFRRNKFRNASEIVTKMKKKRIFVGTQKFELVRQSISPKLKKRSLNSEGEELKMFDDREIFNIANGKFL